MTKTGAEQRCAGRILPLDAAALHICALIATRSGQAGQSLPVMNGTPLITAQCHVLTVAIRDRQDFALHLQAFNHGHEL